ncbi:xylan 1,4-beta-xylosidase [Streptomyces sp. ISL-11]|uniref:xylan 1,4-beta-xylosidase n=1 Tax=Streptomyces sp. ISL-11 TaxID=2819174 RepID=UPI001BE4F843|nr:xylan 1,4-beta-xylosidase [Streptomyces sp. ISL-11]MBT2386153.1 xylan 1,4-beta-xylosidase [Streptomyces sp. ISL-11]
MGRHRVVRALSGARRWRAVALLGAGAVALAVLITVLVTGLPGGGPGGPSAQVPSDIGWGFTHTQYSADRGDDTARKAADKLLADDPMPQNQHIMGWGADNPEPRPGVYNFKDLDRRVALMRRTSGTPVLTLCCAPDWMKGGGSRTDWSQKSLEKAPDRAHYKDFAKLAGVIAKRYPDVRYFIVWNEFKGFFDESRNRWNYEGYTELYNLVHAELKKQNKANAVGGPYISLDSHAPGASSNASSLRGPWGSVDQRALDAITYWNDHKAGADFVAVDGSSYTRDDNRLLPDEFGATQKFADATTWLRKATGLPVWWSEWYVEPGDANDDRKGWTEEHRTAVQATAMMRLAAAGAAAAFYWNPQTTTADCPGCLWRSTERKDGGSGLPMLDLLSRFAKYFPPRVVLRTPELTGPGREQVHALATDDTAVVVNTQDRALAVTVDGRDLDLGPYEVRWLP